MAMTRSTTPASMRAEEHHPPYDRLAALAVGLAVGERPSELLFEREEEPGRQRERGEPQRRDRGELVLATERTRADPEERVGGDAGDQQREADGKGALGEWSAALTGSAAGVTRTTRVSGAPAGRA